MIRLTCPVCQSRLNAKEELAGQTRKCPKCGKPLLIPKAGESWDAFTQELVSLDEVDPEQHVHGTLEEELPSIEAPERLVRINRYLVCDKIKVFAAWQNNGHGWMLKTNHGYISAGRNPEQLPAQGIFTLVELVMSMHEHALRLRGIHCYKLADRWALIALDQGDHAILEKIMKPGCLNKDQKAAIRKYLIEEFMRDVWQDARDVLEYLANTDFHSPGVIYQTPLSDTDHSDPTRAA